MTKEIHENGFYGYGIQRKTLAAECAQQLGIKEFNPLLYEISVEKSALPGDMINDDSYIEAMSEQSLLTFAMVYRHGGSLTVTDIQGHTLIMPDLPVVREELKRCGYCICNYGATYPEGIVSSYNAGLNLDDYLKTQSQLKEEREKYTLSEDLMKRTLEIEPNRFPKAIDDCPYDVFSRDFATNPDYSNPLYTMRIVSILGVDSIETRKFLAAIKCYDTNEEIDAAQDIPSLVNAIKQSRILNDDLYYSKDGIGTQFREYENLHEEENHI